MDTTIACFAGWSNTGKTGFIEALLRELTARGIEAAAAKCVRHEGSFNLPGKDSSRFFAAGNAAALISEREAMVSVPAPAAWDRDYLLALFPGRQVILVEGRIVEGALHVLVGGREKTPEGLKGRISDFDALITGEEELASLARASGLRVFSPEETAAFIDMYVGGATMEERDVSVKAGGTDVPLNPFVKETIENVVLGLVKALKKTDPDAEIVIRIGPAKP